MRAIKATFDGRQIVLPPDVNLGEASEVIVVYEDHPEKADQHDWLKAQEQALSKVWDNSEDAAYDRL